MTSKLNNRQILRAFSRIDNRRKLITILRISHDQFDRKYSWQLWAYIPVFEYIYTIRMRRECNTVLRYLHQQACHYIKKAKNIKAFFRNVCQNWSWPLDISFLVWEHKSINLIKFVIVHNPFWLNTISALFLDWFIKSWQYVIWKRITDEG